jgi:hypothetical protein
LLYLVKTIKIMSQQRVALSDANLNTDVSYCLKLPEDWTYVRQYSVFFLNKCELLYLVKTIKIMSQQRVALSDANLNTDVSYCLKLPEDWTYVQLYSVFFFK